MNALNRLIVEIVKLMPEAVVYFFAKKYIAGKTLEEAVRVVRRLNENGIMATLDVLGESVRSMKEAERAKTDCLNILDAIEKNSLNSNISVKLTQLGLFIDKEACYKNFEEILSRARDLGIFVRIDMEDSSTTDEIFETLLRMRESYNNLGVVIQAKLRRTYQDVLRLNAKSTNYRLCKGIYVEKGDIALQGKTEIRESYMKILGKILENGNYVGIATHDEYLIKKAKLLIESRNIPMEKYEFQMLYGVKEDLRNRMALEGCKMRVYVPYGEQWYAYSVRRLAENPQLAWYITKSIFTVK